MLLSRYIQNSTTWHTVTVTALDQATNSSPLLFPILHSWLEWHSSPLLSILRTAAPGTHHSCHSFAQNLVMVPNLIPRKSQSPCSGPFICFHCEHDLVTSLTLSTPATLASWICQNSHFSAFAWTGLVVECSAPNTCTATSSTSFKPLLQCHLLNKPSSDHAISNCSALFIYHPFPHLSISTPLYPTLLSLSSQST